MGSRRCIARSLAFRPFYVFILRRPLFAFSLHAQCVFLSVHVCAFPVCFLLLFISGRDFRSADRSLSQFDATPSKRCSPLFPDSSFFLCRSRHSAFHFTPSSSPPTLPSRDLEFQQDGGILLFWGCLLVRCPNHHQAQEGKALHLWLSACCLFSLLNSDSRAKKRRRFASTTSPARANRSCSRRSCTGAHS